jgi:hypothetical protein
MEARLSVPFDHDDAQTTAYRSPGCCQPEDAGADDGQIESPTLCHDRP